eukprot:gb/GECG01010336.1/.p1 GENE.gb/GECG01010336.1/~~gb/GECG01010336.1/.p1  ORF type:complete len:113 (+),score=16.30 gb/GECG01010336.1/:1-339(+)
MKNKRAATKRVLLQATQPKTPKRRRHAITRRLSSSASASTSTSHVESSDSSPDEGKQVDSGSVKNANKEYFKWDCPVNDDSIPGKNVVLQSVQGSIFFILLQIPNVFSMVSI